MRRAQHLEPAALRESEVSEDEGEDVSIAWLDADGRHIWWRHQCVDGEHTDMLPWPNWQNKNGTVTPSIVCGRPGCSSHTSPIVRDHPVDWQPRCTIDELMQIERGDA